MATRLLQLLLSLSLACTVMVRLADAYKAHYSRNASAGLTLLPFAMNNDWVKLGEQAKSKRERTIERGG